MSRLSVVLSVSASVIFAATAAQAAPVQGHSPSSIPSFNTHLIAGADYICETKLFGKRARLWMEGDTPKHYKWHNNSKRSAKLKGNTIRIQASPMATISNVVIGENSSGQKTVSGDFKFKSNEQDGLVFTCEPG